MDPLYVVLALVFGALIGLLLGLLGGGGSILTVPVLVYVMGQSVRLATGTSLAIVGLNALFGSLTHHRAGRVRWRLGLGFGAAGILGALAGTWLNALVRGETVLFLFAFVMLAAAAGMLRPIRAPKAGEAPPNHGPAYVLRLSLTGLAVGALTGFFGVGGGFLIVPALALVVGLPVREAMATSLVAIAVNSAAGLAGRLGLGGVDLVTTGLFAAGGFAGAAGGARWAGALPERALRRWFAYLVIALAVYLLYRNFGAVLGQA
jgi:uncharacterized membrane protein YfcA